MLAVAKPHPVPDRPLKQEAEDGEEVGPRREHLLEPNHHQHQDQDQHQHQNQHQNEHQHQHQHQNQNQSPNLSLPGSTRPVDILGAAFRRFWRTSHTVLRLDIQKSSSAPFHAPDAITANRGARHAHRNRRHGHNARDDDDDDQGTLGRWIRGLDGGGARMKIMQSWEFPDKETGLPGLPWSLNFGFGATVQADNGGLLLPQMRLKAKHFAFYILPLPLFELRGKWPIKGTRVAIDIRYRIPLLNLEHIWESPTAHLCVHLYNPLGTGFHITPGGVEFDEHIVNIGHHTKLRVAASIDFPSHFPLDEGEQPVKVHINRLGVKTRVS